MDAVIVTRHPSLVELLIERGMCPKDTPVITHASPDDVRGKHVIGVLPMHLACLTASVTEVPVQMSREDREDAQRGDLPLSRLREIAGEPVTYRVTRAPERVALVVHATAGLAMLPGALLLAARELSERAKQTVDVIPIEPEVEGYVDAHGYDAVYVAAHGESSLYARRVVTEHRREPVALDPPALCREEWITEAAHLMGVSLV